MSTIIDTRLENLEALASQYRFVREFCEAASMSPSYMSQLRAGTKTLGNTLARQIEERLGLEPGSLDERSKVVQLPSNAPAADVMSAAYAMQSMDPGVRAAFMRLALEVAASHIKKPVDANQAQPFEVTHDTKNTRSAEGSPALNRAGSAGG